MQTSQLAELVTDERFRDFKERRAHRDMLAKIIDEEFARAPTQEWVRKLSGHVPIAPALTLQKAFDNQYFHDIGAFSISLTRKSMTSK